MRNDPRMKAMGLVFALVLGTSGLFTVAQAARPQSSPPPLVWTDALSDPDQARTDYVEHCAGCHGVQGKSAPAELPELRDRVGWFMCTPETRAYLLQLPNVAHSRILDNQELADMMNFVVFGLGGSSAPAGARPFTADEVGKERKLPLESVSLKAERARHVKAAIRKCRAPVSLRLMYEGEPKALRR